MAAMGSSSVKVSAGNRARGRRTRRRHSLDLAIIGNGAAAAEAALAIRGARYRGSIDLFADNPHPPYNPMLGTYYASAALAAEACFPFGGAEFYDRLGIRARLDAPVAELDPREKTLTTAGGDRFTYRRCLVASGASTVFPPIPGIAAPEVVGLRSFADAERLKEKVAGAVARAGAEHRPPRGLVLGASFAGLEVAAVLRRAGFEVGIVEREENVLPRVVHPACATAIERRLRALGYEVKVGTVVASIAAVAGGVRARLRAAAGERAQETAAGEAADLMVVCTGTRPNLGFLLPGTVAVQTGLLADEHLATGAPDLFAAGDVAQALDPLSGAHEVVALWAVARRQGRVAGLNMVGEHAEHPGSISCNIQHVGDLLFASGGSVTECDRVEVRRDGDDRLAVLAYRDDRLAGFNLLGDVRAAGPLVQAIARGAGGRAEGRPGAGGLAAATLQAAMKRITWTSVNEG